MGSNVKLRFWNEDLLNICKFRRGKIFDGKGEII